MSLVGYKGRNHPQQVAKRGPNGLVDDRGTDPEFFATLEDRFGRFTLDVAAAPHNAKCDRFFTEADDGLSLVWDSDRIWCNPPYSNIGAWVERAWGEHVNGRELIVMLLPANRTEQKWWQELVEPYRRVPTLGFSVEFLPGRLRFIKPGATEIGPNERPPFGCCLLIWQAADTPQEDG